MSIIFRLFYFFIVFTIILFALDNHSLLEIKNQFLKTFVIYGFLIGSFLSLAFNIFAFKETKIKVTFSIISLSILLYINYLGLLKILFSKSIWMTQTELYQNNHFTNKKVEFQLKDLGALGYDKRTVEVFYLTPYFCIISEAKENYSKPEWTNTNKDINEAELKGG